MRSDTPKLPRLVAMSRTGRFVAIRQRYGIDIVDALGTEPRRTLELAGLIDFACVGDVLWAVAGGALRRFALDDGEPIGDDATLDADSGRLHPAQGEAASSALWLGYKRLEIDGRDGEVTVEDVTGAFGPGAFTRPLSGRRTLVVEDGVLRLHDPGRGEVARATLPAEGDPIAGAGLFGGRALAVLLAGDERSSFVVVRPNGSLVHNVKLPALAACALAENRGLALAQLADSTEMIAVDLRYGKLLSQTDAPLPVEDLAIDCDAKYLVVSGFEPRSVVEGTDEVDGVRDADTLSVLHIPYTDLFGGGGSLAPRRRRDAPVKPVEVEEPEPGPKRLTREPIARRVDAAATTDEPPAEPEPSVSTPVEIPDVPLLGLGRLVTPARAKAPAGVRPHKSPSEHLDELLDLVAARTARAIASAWDSGRLSLPSEDARPFEREVYALVGNRLSLAPDALTDAEDRLSKLTAIAGRRALASLAAGMSLPFVNLAREFDLSTTAAQVLLVAAAPSLRGEIARLYGVLANDENRPICDRYLIELILGGDDRATRNAVAQELAPDATLIKHGLIRLLSASQDQYLFAPVTVDTVLLSRLRGDRFGGTGPSDCTTIRWADRAVEELVMPDALKRDTVLALAGPRRDGTPHRVVVRGRLGAGRRTLAAALAMRLARPLAVIDCERLPRAGRLFAEGLRVELLRAGLRGAVACVSGLEVFDATDAEGLEHLRAVFRRHPAPVIIRTSPEYKPPLDPGYVSFTIPTLTEQERYEVWVEALARSALRAEGAERLAARFRIGPGTIETVIENAGGRMESEPEPPADATEFLDQAARQHISVRMGNVASHITRLARWEQVALPDDVFDSVREFIARVKHRRTVYDQWGFDAKMSTSRGLTALFYGPPGTGKSMVAGLIARELNLDLYRVDLARITSKWIGETEKNLAEVFDAGEDGQCVILFDEADSLFAKRTEVKSSVDRYANLEVNYLLQRMDTFEGVAILTTNLEGSMDTAFKRRMSLRLSFPFPDEEMRVRLWAVHIPAEVPTAGDFDFEDLAKRFPMSGGYIRNSAIRAAFLAAQENLPISQDHLVRAIHLEYREMGKLAPGGRME